MTKNRASKKAIRVKAEKSGMSYQATLQAGGSPSALGVLEWDACCQTFLDNKIYCYWLSNVDNLSPWIDLQNYFVCCHLSEVALAAFQRVEATDRRVSSVRVTRTHFEAIAETASGSADMGFSVDMGVEYSPSQARVKMPDGLYDHLVAVSKKPRIPFPSFPTPTKTSEIALRVDAVVFGPGTVNGQRFWLNAVDFAYLRKLPAERFRLETRRGQLMLGRQGDYVHPTDPAEYREACTARFVPQGCVMLQAADDKRGLEEFRFPLDQLPEKYTLKGDWTTSSVIDVREFHEAEGDASCHSRAVPPGRYVVGRVFAGTTADATEVVLYEFETRKMYTTTASFLDETRAGQKRTTVVADHYLLEVVKNMKPVSIQAP